MSNFDEDADLEEKLQQDPRDLDEDELQDLQIYKSQKLQALRDAGESGDKPDWWQSDHAPETLDELAGAVTGDGEAPSGSGAEESDEEPEDEAAEEESAEEEPEEKAPEEKTDEEPAETADEEPESEPEPSPEPTESKGVPQVGWSSGVAKTDEIDFDNDVLEGIYQRQDEIMETLQAINQGMSEVDVGGEAIDSIQSTLNELNDKVDALSQGDGEEGSFVQKVNEIHEVLATTRDLESKLAELPPLPSEDDLLEAGIIDKAVEHENSDNCFQTSVDGRKAALHYGPGAEQLTAYHFAMPSILSESVRHAVEDVLARALFDFAQEEGKAVMPQQPRLRSGFLARHPEYYEQTPDSVQKQRA